MILNNLCFSVKLFTVHYAHIKETAYED